MPPKSHGWRISLAAGGYSLMEIIAVISVVAVFASVVLPSVNNFFVSQSVAAEASKLTSDVRLARSWTLQTQTYTRIVFRTTNPFSWVVQELVDGSNNSVTGERDFTMTDIEIGSYSVTPTYWRSIIDNPSREIDPSVELVFTPASPWAIFFRADGILVASPESSAAPYGALTVKFKQEASEMTVDITPAGAVESVAWYDENYQ